MIAATAKGKTIIHDWVYENRAIYLTELNRLGARVQLLDPHRVIVEGPTRWRGQQVVCPPRCGPRCAFCSACSRLVASRCCATSTSSIGDTRTWPTGSMPWAPTSRSSGTELSWCEPSKHKLALAETHRFEAVAGMDELLLSRDQSQLDTAGGNCDLKEPIDHRRGVGERLRHVPQTRRLARKVAAVTSPLPVKVWGSRGVVTSHAPSALTATMSIFSGDPSSRTTLVTKTTSGPRPAGGVSRLQQLGHGRDR